jgi:meiotically up-regulated gene 157 (Mug157) protein
MAIAAFLTCESYTLAEDRQLKSGSRHQTTMDSLVYSDARVRKDLCQFQYVVPDSLES